MAVNKVIEIDLQSNAGTGLEAINTEINKVAESSKSLKTQLREAQLEVATLADKFGATSKEAVNAAKKAGELKDKIGDAKALTDAFNPDAKFKALTASLGGVASGFAAYQGALGLVGVESKDLEEQLLKVQSAMAISQGLQGIGESVDSFKQLGAVIKNTSVAQKVLSATTAAYTFVTEASTAGLKLFRLALISTGIGAIVVGLGLLVANFDKVKKAVLNVVPGLANVGEAIGNIVNSVTDFIGATSEADRALDKLKDNADKTLAVNKKFMTEHASQVDEYTKKKLDAKNAYAEAIKEDGADQVALAKELNRQLEKIEYSRGDEKRKIQKEASDKANADRKAESDKALNDLKESNKKYKEETQSGLVDLRTAYLNNDIQKKVEQVNLKDEQLALLEEGVAQEQVIETIKTDNAKKESDNRVEITKAEFQQKKEIQDAEFALAEGAVNFIKSIAGKNKGLQKAAIIAENAIGIGKMIIANNAANIGALATPQAIATSGASAAPVIAMNNITTALGVATTLASTAKALQAVGGGSAGGAPKMGGMAGGGGGATPTPQFNVVGNTGINQIASSIGAPQPVQAYVVAGAVTTGQALNRNIISNASMG